MTATISRFFGLGWAIGENRPPAGAGDPSGARFFQESRVRPARRGGTPRVPESASDARMRRRVASSSRRACVNGHPDPTRFAHRGPIFFGATDPTFFDHVDPIVKVAGAPHHVRSLYREWRLALEQGWPETPRDEGVPTPNSSSTRPAPSPAALRNRPESNRRRFATMIATRSRRRRSRRPRASRDRRGTHLRRSPRLTQLLSSSRFSPPTRWHSPVPTSAFGEAVGPAGRRPVTSSPPPSGPLQGADLSSDLGGQEKSDLPDQKRSDPLGQKRSVRRGRLQACRRAPIGPVRGDVGTAAVRGAAPAPAYRFPEDATQLDLTH
jgi:hypothetical protein